jgi:orotate phosphoribosyltransferase
MVAIDKNTLIKEIIDLELFVVFDPNDKSQWFILKDESPTQYFLDNKKIMSFPRLFKKINQYIVQIIRKENLKFNRIMGIPYGGLPFAYGIADMIEAPCLAIRREGKRKYGTKSDLLGIFEKGERVLFIEDAIVTAQTVISFAKRLKQDDLLVTDVVSIIDAKKTGRKNLEKYGINLHSLFIGNDFVDFYKKNPPKGAYLIT